MRANVAKRMMTTATARPLMITTGCCRISTRCSFGVRLFHGAVVGRQLVRRGELRPSVHVRDALLHSKNHDLSAALELLAGLGTRAVGVTGSAESVHDLASSTTLNGARHLRHDALHLKVLGRENSEARVDELGEEG